MRIVLVALLLLVSPALVFAQAGAIIGAGVPISGPGSGTVTSVNGTTNQIVCTNPTTAAVCSIAGLAGVAGAVSVTGTSGNGSDFINGVNLNNELNVLSFGASGSNATGITATAGATSTSVTLSAAGDYKNGQGILLVGAGPAKLYATPAAPTLTNHGTAGAGATTYTYLLVTTDAWGGYSAAGATVQTTTGPAVLNEVNYQSVNTPAITCNACAVAVYRQTGGAGNFVRIGMIPNNSGSLGDTNLPALTDNSMPNTIPSSGILAAANQNLVATITAGGGTTSLTIGTATVNAITGAATYHDDTTSFQNALTAITAAGGGVLDVPPGTYNFDQISTWNNTTWVYTNPTSEVLANRTLGLLHLPSNVWIRGAGRTSTILQVPMMPQGAIINYIMAAANPVTTTIPGAPCNTGLNSIVTTYPMNNVARGSNWIATTTAGNAANFSPGDDIYYGGGVNSAAISCSSGQPHTEVNRVVSVDASTGRLYLRYPVTVDYPFGIVGTALFVGQINAYAHNDVYVTDLSMPSIAGGAAINFNTTLRWRLARVDMQGEAWNGKLNCGGSRDGTVDDANWESTGGEQFDSCYDLRIINSNYQNHSGGTQGSFDESGSGFTFFNNLVSSDDALGGIGNRAASGTTTGFGLKAVNDVLFTHNQFNMNTVQSNVVINNALSYVSTVPLPSDWDISDNIFRLASSTGATQGIVSTDPGYNATYSRNRFYLNAGASVSAAFQVLSGDIDSNSINEADNLSTNGLIGIINSVASLPTIPLYIHGNHLVLTAGSAGSSIGIKENASQAIAVYAENNVCVGVNSCIQNVAAIPFTYLADNIGGVNYLNSTSLIYGDACRHGMIAPTSVGSGYFNTNASDCGFEVLGNFANASCVGAGNPKACCTGSTTGTCPTAFTDTITFQKAFAIKPTFSCTDETTQAALTTLVGTTTLVVGGGTAADSFNCHGTGF